MNLIELKLVQAPRFRIDMRSIHPADLATRTASQIEHLELPIGRQTIPLGELFKVRCRNDDHSHATIRLRGDCQSCDYIGHQMSAGEWIVEGDCGDYLGKEMQAGSITVEGNVADHTAQSMRGGQIKIRGNVGDYLGGPASGERSGMSGGEIHVSGNAGDQTGYRLRRGTIIIEGNAGKNTAAEMVAGTIAIHGRVGDHVGNGMRRGTILLSQRPSLSPFGFTEPRRESPAILSILLTQFVRITDGKSQLVKQLQTNLHDSQRVLGDKAVQGQGEIFWFAKEFVA